jgi:HSP20 family protein
MDRLLNDVFTTRHPGREAATQEWAPPIEMFETEQGVVVRAELPNIDPKQIEITVTNDTMTLRGETRHEEEHKERNYHRREIRYGSFSRTLALPTAVNSTEAKATYRDGVLEVMLPKPERVKPASVKVQVA